MRETTVGLTPLALLVLVVGIGVAGYGGYDYVRQSGAVDGAVAVETAVVDATVEESVGRSLSYRVTVEHTYEYRGTEYTSERVFPGATSPQYFVRSDAEGVIEPYEPGTATTAYVPPGAPGRAFLERRTTGAPFKFVAFGGALALLTALRAVGSRDPVGNAEPRPEAEGGPAPYETLFGVDRETVHRLSKRLLVVAPAVLLGSLAITAVLALSADGSSVTVDLTDPIGLGLLATLLAALGLTAGLVLYVIWSFTECRRLRRRIPEPRPPSPFRHPPTLVSVLADGADLNEYGRRVRMTTFALAFVAFFVGTVAFVLVTGS